ncbi:MAG: hypothetical protein ACRCSV_04580 [Chlamydiales bacterium]
MLRTDIEDFCVAFQIDEDPEARSVFLKGKFKSSNSIKFIKKTDLRNAKSLVKLHGEFSNKNVHHSYIPLLVCQIDSMENDVIRLVHIKRIDPSNLLPQLFPLHTIAMLLIEIGQLTENMYFKSYFIKSHSKGYIQPCLDIPEFILLREMNEIIRNELQKLTPNT